MLALTLFVLLTIPAQAERVTIPLDGVWRIGESVSAEDVPKVFGHTAPVPGMANLAVPEFPDIDRFDSREVINLINR